MQWINHGEQTVYENPWLTVNIADVELPDGRHLKHTVIRERPVVLCAALNDRDEVLLLYRHRFIPNTWGWEVPGGGGTTGKALKMPPPENCSRRLAGRPPALSDT
ncbi:MAG TPA: hypothetical protein VIL34_14590 [Actinopolymorphaceae bacterium]